MRRKAYKEIVTLLIMLLLPLYFIFTGGYYQWLAGYIYLYLIQGYVAWFLFFKCNQPFFGYSVTMGIGAFGTIVPVEVYGWPMLPAILLATLLSGILAVVIFVATSRAKGFYVGMVSFMLAIMLPKLIEALRDITGGRSGLSFYGLAGTLGYNTLSLLIVLVAVALVGFLFWLMRTKTGRILTIMAENDELAKAVGINTFNYKMLAYAISGLLSGLGGALYVNYTGSISSVDLNVFTTIKIVFIPIIGGSNVLYGPYLGTLFIRLLPETLASFERYLYIIFGLVFILVLVWLRGGIGSGVAWTMDKLSDILGRNEKPLTRVTKSESVRTESREEKAEEANEG